MDRDILEVPAIVLEWSEWVPWDDLKVDARSAGGLRLPQTSGVYEVRHSDADERLTIGRAGNLRFRVKQGLVKGKAPHSEGRRIRATEDVSRLVVRWAVTDRPAAAEEELHKRHVTRFGRLPKYVKHT
jgi:excinuclease UvrABC nuclease subunit